MKLWLAKLWKALKLPKHFQLGIMRVIQDAFLVGVTGIIFNADGEVLLVKHTYRGKGWSLPGGYMKAKEHPKEGLEREIFEETQLTVSADERLKIRTDRETARLDITYVGTFIGGEFVPSAEVSDAKFFAFDRLPELSTSQLMLIEQAIQFRANTDRLKTI